MNQKSPKLRTVKKSTAAFPLNKFPAELPYLVGKELVFILASKGKPELEGSDWESIFAACIGAEWKPSNVGLDDVTKGNTAWGAKTVKANNPARQKKVRLISGRNSPVYSFGEKVDTSADPKPVGKSILGIWNERVSSIRETYKNLRTVVLIKSNDLSEVVVFEFETIRYDYKLFDWSWNPNHNLIGIDKKSGDHKFTWQPHGSQFTIIENVPKKNLLIRITKPQSLDKELILKSLGFKKNWIEVIHNNG